MHLGGAWIGKADVNTARHQGPYQTFRTVHRCTPVVTFLSLCCCRSIFTGAFRQSVPGQCCYNPTVMPLHLSFEDRGPFGVAACEIAQGMACFAAKPISLKRA